MAPQKYTLLQTSEQTQTVTKTSNSTCFYLLVLANLVIFVILLHLNSVPQNIQVNFADNRISQYIKDSNMLQIKNSGNKQQPTISVPDQSHINVLPIPSNPDDQEARFQVHNNNSVHIDNSKQLFIMVLSGRKDKSKRDGIRETWAKTMNNKNIAFLVGETACKYSPDLVESWTCDLKNNFKSKSSESLFNSEKQQKYEIAEGRITDSILEEDLTLVVPMMDFYRGLPRKLKLGYKWVLENTDAKWIAKTDDDMFVKPDELEKLVKNYNPDENLIIGKIAKGWGVARGGKWAEKVYPKSNYPDFPVGSAGHIISRPVAEYIVRNIDKLHDYQGEDTSMGIWMEENKEFKVKFVNDAHLSNLGKCDLEGKFIVGHNINPAKMKQCYEG